MHVFHIWTYHSKYVWDVIDCVLLAATGPVVQEVVNVHFQLLQVVFWHVGDVVLQLVQRGQLHVRDHAPLLVEAPQDASHQTERTEEQGM